MRNTRVFRPSLRVKLGPPSTVARMKTTIPDSNISFLPPNDCLRVELHNEVHARPTAHVQLPSLVTYVAVLNAQVPREKELEHLQALPGQQNLCLDDLSSNFLRMQCGLYSVKWERHTEFSRYSIVHDLTATSGLGSIEPVLTGALGVRESWLACSRVGADEKSLPSFARNPGTQSGDWNEVSARNVQPGLERTAGETRARVPRTLQIRAG